MEGRKSIAFVVHSLNAGGAERVLCTLANEFTSKYNVYIITLVKCVPFYPLNRDIVLDYSSQGIKPNRGGMFSIIENFKHVLNIYRICKKNRVDLLIGFTTTSSVLSIISSKLLGIKNIISERNNPILYPPNKFWTFFRNLTYPFANYLVVQTKANKEYFRNWTNHNKINIILNPISQDLVRNRALTKSKEKIILSVGRINENKSQDLLIRAFANLQNEGWAITLVGDGPKMDEFKNLAIDLGIGPQVNFVGNRLDVYEFYNRAMIFVFTSKSEGLPNALLEALYFGLPCISTDCPNGPSDLIQNNENGYLIEVDNQKELEHTLSLLMNDIDVRKKFTQNAVNNAEKFEIKEIVNQWDQLVTDLTSTNRFEGI